MKDDQIKSEFGQSEIDLGERKISKMNFSYIVCIPKIFVNSTQFEQITSVRIIQGNGYLKLVPSRAKHGDQEVELWGSKKE
jgi:hypothetical protein